MKVLTIQEEKQILAYLINAKFLDNGASRCVFNCSKEIADFLGIDGDNYIVKLACGVGGVRQTQAEVSCFLDHPDAPLAEIIAYGRYVEIMEYVHVDCDYRDFACDCYEDEPVPYELLFDEEDEDNAELYAEAEKAYDAIIRLHDIFGHTADNGQLGYNFDGRLVAYDYGFDAGSGCDEQTSSITDYIDDRIQRNAYISALIELMDKSMDVLAAWEAAFCGEDDNEDDTAYNHSHSYGVYRYKVIGIDKNNNTYRQHYSNFAIVKEICKQLTSYVIFKKTIRCDKKLWEQHTLQSTLIKQYGDRAAELLTSC